MTNSLPVTFSSTLTTQVTAMLHSSKPKFILRYIEVQHQNGADDCGLFAIAFAEALCAGKDPHLLSFDQKKMRQHLQSNLEGGTITEFPSAAKPRRSKRRRVKISRDIPIYCRCRLPWSLQSYIQGVWELDSVFTLQGVVPSILPASTRPCFSR